VTLVYQMLGPRPGENGDGSEQTRQQIPPLLHRPLDSWSRLSELTADRFGFLATGEALPVAVSSFFKMASGLGPEHLNFDLAAFLAQLEQLQKLERREVLAHFSHPVTPVRARALQLFAAAGGSQASPQRLAEVDHEVKGNASLMEFEASTESGAQAREFLVGRRIACGQRGRGGVAG
jgi:hypothetical protein